MTERVAAEARFLAAAETLRDGLAIFDAEDRLVYHNRRYPEHQMANVRAVLALGKRYQDLLRDALALGPIHHPDMGADFPQRRVEMRKQPYSEHEQHLADGRWVLVREGRMADGGLVLVTSDITERRALEAELRQAEKLKAVGTLASGIAHDFNNILATIFTSTEVAMLHLPEDAPARPALDRVLAAGNRARQLIAEILTFSRSERTPRVAIDVGATVASAIDFCRHALTPSIELRADLPADPVYRRRRREPDPPDRQQPLPERGASHAGRWPDLRAARERPWPRRSALGQAQGRRHWHWYGRRDCGARV